jgi:hypothetical protein
VSPRAVTEGPDEIAGRFRDDAVPSREGTDRLTSATSVAIASSAAAGA